jgi:hypothetical protein
MRKFPHGLLRFSVYGPTGAVFGAGGEENTTDRYCFEGTNVSALSCAAAFLSRCTSVRAVFQLLYVIFSERCVDVERGA